MVLPILTLEVKGTQTTPIRTKVLTTTETHLFKFNNNDGDSSVVKCLWCLRSPQRTSTSPHSCRHHTQKTMQTFIEATGKIFTLKEILTYYRNIWMQHVIARAIDVQTDVAKKANNPEEEVENIDPITRQISYITVKERLELRKILVKEAQEIVSAIDTMLAVEEDKIAETFLGEKALAVDEDMLKPKAGDVCTTEDGRQGHMFDSQTGLVCLAKKEETPAVDAETAPVEEAVHAEQGEDPQPEPENTPDETPSETKGENEEEAKQ